MREEISEIVGFELDDQRLESVTVTDVKISDDLRDANVYVIVEGPEAEKTAALRTLQHASGFVRQQIAMNLSLRHVPHIHFVRDTAEENAARIGSILDEMSARGEFDKRTDSE